MSISGSALRGVSNPLRHTARTAAVVSLLALVLVLLALMVEAAQASRQKIAAMESRVQTLIELREAGAFGTGGFGGDSPIGKEGFTVATLHKTRQIPHARHLARVDEYVYKPEMDPTKGNAYAMIIGFHPGAAMRAIGEVDYENARIIAGRALGVEDTDARVAVVGMLYARQRLGIESPSDLPPEGRPALFNGQAFQVVGIYTTANDFGDNHVFMPINVFREVYRPGDKLSKIFVTVDSVSNVPKVVEELRAIPEADVVTSPESVATARSALGSLSMASTYAAVMLFIIGAVLIVFVMILSTRERVREIGTLKALGASNREVVAQFLAEAVTISAIAGVLAAAIALPLILAANRILNVDAGFGGSTVLLIILGSIIFAGLGSIYPVAKGIRLGPIAAMRSAS
jgi:putative ABC transport system permease protein